MSVSYHLMPVDQTTGAFINLNSFEQKLENNFSIFAELMMNFPDPLIAYFDKHELVFDFVYSLSQLEISAVIYQPENLRVLFLELLEILKNKTDCPIQTFHYFRYEELMESNFLYVNLKGSELNKIVEDKVYHNDSDFDINVSFDRLNNYATIGSEFNQRPVTVYITTDEDERFRSFLDLNAFPGELSINRTLRNIRLEKEVKNVSLILKTPYEYLLPMFTNLIAICDLCEANGYGIKSFVSC